MEPFNTGNPVGEHGSADLRDLHDNAQNLDRAVTGEGEWTDRLGNQRSTLKKIEADYPLASVFAAEAEGYRGEAAVSASSSSTSAAQASVAADRAELAEGNAFANADLFGSIAEGLDPITGVAEGEQFQVLSAGGDSYIRYRHDAGPVATPVSVEPYPTAGAVQAIRDSADDLFRVDKTELFPDANLPVRRYTGASTFNDYAAGYSQTAVAGGLRVAIPASGSGTTKHYLKTSTRVSPGGRIVAEFADLSGTLFSLSLGIGFLTNAGEYVAYALSNTGNLVRFDGFTATNIQTGLGTYATGAAVRIEIEAGVLQGYVNDALWVEYALPPGLFETELLVAQAGFATYTHSLQVASDPIRKYVTEEIAPLSSSIATLEQTAVVDSTLQERANSLFEATKDQLFPNANLVVRRYTGTSTFNDYAAGYSQTAVAGGLQVQIPASGSTGITHYLRTADVSTAQKIVASFDMTSSAALSAAGVGYINEGGEYVAYSLSGSGVVRKYTGYAFSTLTGIIAPYTTGDTLRFEVASNRLIIFVNDVSVHSVDLADGEFATELLIFQAGFPQYVVDLSYQSDPVRRYVQEELSSANGSVRPMYVSLAANNSLTVYTPTPSGKYISYPLERTVNAAINYDCWAFIGADEFSLIDGSMVPTGRFPNKIISTSSVQEAPWRETPGGDDFISGVAHGGEMTESLILIIDGDIVDATTGNLFSAAKSVRMVVTSIVESNITPGQQVIRRKRVYDFDERGMSLDQQNTFLADKSFTILYHNAVGHSDVFTSYALDQELTVQTLDGVGRSVAGDMREYTLLGSGVSAKVTVEQISPPAPSPRILIAASKKVYFDLLNGGAGATSAIAGDFWRIKSRYEISLP